MITLPPIRRGPSPVFLGYLHYQECFSSHQKQKHFIVLQDWDVNGHKTQHGLNRQIQCLHCSGCKFK